VVAMALWGCGSSESFDVIIPDARIGADTPLGPGPDASLGADASPDNPTPLAETGHDVPLSGLTIVPSSPQSFAATVGQSSSAITLVIANTGAVAAGPLAFTMTGPNADEFRATARGCDAIAPGSACTVSIVFTPQVAAATPKTANLNVTDTGPGGATASVSLLGTGSATCSCGIWPPSGDLGTVVVGATGAPVAFTLANSGDTPSGPLTVSVSSSDFVIVSDTCTAVSLAPMGGTCTVSIALRPATFGAKSATLTIAEVNGTAVVKTLTGTAVAASQDASLVATPDVGAPIDQTIDHSSRPNPAPDGGAGLDGGASLPEVPPSSGLLLSPGVIDLGNLVVGTPAPWHNITLTTLAALTDLSVVSIGENVSIVSTSCTSVLAVADTCTVVVSFVAESAGSKRDSIVFTGGGQTAIVAITAFAQNPAKLAIDRTVAAFTGTVGVATSPITFTLTNTGDLPTGPLSVAITGLDAADFTATSGCLILAPLASCTVSVVFKAPAPVATADVATLRVTDTGIGGSAVSAILSGIAL
jgi:hypothetical protein